MTNYVPTARQAVHYSTVIVAPSQSASDQWCAGLLLVPVFVNTEVHTANLHVLVASLGYYKLKVCLFKHTYIVLFLLRQRRCSLLIMIQMTVKVKTMMKKRHGYS